MHLCRGNQAGHWQAEGGYDLVAERLFDIQSAELDVEKRRELVWEIDARLLADGARPPIMWNRAATCWQSYVKGYVSHVNSMYNGFRFEDVWLDRP